jgi:NMD protein affecting ribosome stability and mRNA decay
MAKAKTANHLRQGRRARLLQELTHDPYKSKRKLREPVACPGCGAIYRAGRWQWGPKPEDADSRICPACRRIKEDVPAGFLSLQGSFLENHLEEILNLARNVGEREKENHPLKRIMATQNLDGGGLLITTTDSNLARGIGEALRSAYGGELNYQYGEESDILRAGWSREE